MEDVRNTIFAGMMNARITACIYTDMDGMLSGVDEAVKQAGEIGVTVEYCAAEGDEVMAGDLIMQIVGTPIQITKAEDYVMGRMSKFSGIATAASAFVRKAGDKGPRIVGGAWKKMPAEEKNAIRKAEMTGGADVHITNEPMIYMDKNYVEMLGGIQKALMAVKSVEDRKKCIQIKGRYEGGDIVREARTAISSGADIVFVDSGKIEDLRRVTKAMKPELDALRESGFDRDIVFAYAGNVTLDDIEAIREAGGDVVDIGRAIIDAPLLDMRLEVTKVEDPRYDHSDFDLLDKSELQIDGILLNDTNLNDLAAIVAEEIGVTSEDVLVIDVRYGGVSLDVLQKKLDPTRFVSKEETILRRLSELPGVQLMPGAGISSNGMLGWIVGDDSTIEESIEAVMNSRNIVDEVRRNVSNRVIVFPTGAEVEAGEIEDTNTPLLIKKFRDAGYTADKGDVLKDDITAFSYSLRHAAEQAYGVCITTGGVGAENKDFSVEAIEMLDPSASTPYIAKFVAGHGRHSKDGIRIGVGQAGMTTYIALPGPNDEVTLCADVVVRGISEGWSKEVLAHEIAKILRDRLKEKIGVKQVRDYPHHDMYHHHH